MCASCDTDYSGTVEAVWEANEEVYSQMTVRVSSIARIIHLYHEGFTAAQISEFFRSRYNESGHTVHVQYVEGLIEAFA